MLKLHTINTAILFCRHVQLEPQGLLREDAAVLGGLQGPPGLHRGAAQVRRHSEHPVSSRRHTAPRRRQPLPRQRPALN